MGDWITNLAERLTIVLEAGVEVLAYSGDKDFICNWRGGESWTHEVEWHGKSEFNN